MGSIVEQAAAEADAAEAEFPDDDEAELEEAEEGAETDPEEDSGASLTEKQREKIIGRLDNESDRHTKRVAEILGPDVSDLAPCPACWEHAPGFVLNGVMLDEVQAAMVRGLLGIQDTPSYKTNPEYAICETCDGLGMVLSGSKVANQEIQPCPKCQNKGFERIPIAWQPPPAPPLVAVPTPTQDWAALPPGPVDQWGRPAGHPHFGMDPAKIGMAG